MFLLIRILINAGALWAATQFVSGISFTGDIARFLVVALVFGLLNALVRPILLLLSLPLLILTLGLFTFVLNAVILMLLGALSDVLGKKLPYDSLGALRQAIAATAPHLMRIDQIEAGDPAAIKALAGKDGSIEKTPFKSAIEDYYLTNPIARASAVMAECSRLASGQILTAAE